MARAFLPRPRPTTSTAASSYKPPIDYSHRLAYLLPPSWPFYSVSKLEETIERAHRNPNSVIHENEKERGERREEEGLSGVDPLSSSPDLVDLPWRMHASTSRTPLVTCSRQGVQASPSNITHFLLIISKYRSEIGTYNVIQTCINRLGRVFLYKHVSSINPNRPHFDPY